MRHPSRVWPAPRAARHSRGVAAALGGVITLALLAFVAAADLDADGVDDSRDWCPRTPALTELKDGDSFDPVSGCAQSQVDIDLDGVCNRQQPIKGGKTLVTSMCAGEDNCPFVYNPLQTDTFGDARGDACDPSTCNSHAPSPHCAKHLCDTDGVCDTLCCCDGVLHLWGRGVCKARGALLAVPMGAWPRRPILGHVHLPPPPPALEHVHPRLQIPRTHVSLTRGLWVCTRLLGWWPAASERFVLCCPLCAPSSLLYRGLHGLPCGL